MTKPPGSSSSAEDDRPLPARAVLLLGSGEPVGSYVLRIRLEHALKMPFGRYRGGRELSLSAGAYAYVGSALGRGASSLGRRLVRHASRSASRPPQAIRPELLRRLAEAGLSEGPADLLPRRSKRLHWHVDHLLDRPEARLDRILALRDPRRLETEIAGWLAAHPATSVPAAGLGASDARGATHLMRVPADEAWWQDLVRAGERALRDRLDS